MVKTKLVALEKGQDYKAFGGLVKILCNLIIMKMVQSKELRQVSFFMATKKVINVKIKANDANERWWTYKERRPSNKEKYLTG